jgi:hypothetical protein
MACPKEVLGWIGYGVSKGGTGLDWSWRVQRRYWAGLVMACPKEVLGWIGHGVSKAKAAGQLRTSLFSTTRKVEAASSFETPLTTSDRRRLES